MQLSCHDCALRACGLFKPVSEEELDSINQIKSEHLSVPAGAEIIRAGDAAPELYTLYSGWAFRFKTLPDGRRQILNFLLPGDLLGLQAAMFDAALHGIEALTEAQLCVLPQLSRSMSRGSARVRKALSTRISPARDAVPHPSGSRR